MPTPEEYIALFGEDFLELLDALDELTPELEDMLLATLDDMVFEVEVFGTQIEKQVAKLSKAGMTMEVIEETLSSDLNQGGRIIGQLNNSIKTAIVDGVNQSSRLGQYGNFDLDDEIFVWITVSSRVCDDCQARQGRRGTFEEFEAQGLPGSGRTVCGAYCYCVLDPTGEISTRVTVPNARERGA